MEQRWWPSAVHAGKSVAVVATSQQAALSVPQFKLPSITRATNLNFNMIMQYCEGNCTHMVHIQIRSTLD